MYSPQPHGLVIEGGGKLTAQDSVYVDAVVRRFLNFKQVSNLENLRRYYDLPNGGRFIVQYMGGIFRVIIYKNPNDTDEKLNNIKSKKLSISHKNKKHSNESKNKIKLSNSGEKSYMAKLNNSTAKEIRDLLLKDPTINFTKLGEKYDVGGWVIYGVIKNETYYDPDYNYTMFLNSKN